MAVITSAIFEAKGWLSKESATGRGQAGSVMTQNSAFGAMRSHAVETFSTMRTMRAGPSKVL
jgi:hypothetical protein